MGLLKPAKNQTAFLKLGAMGFAGSGKTFTAAEIAIGLTQYVKGKQIAFFDSEKGSDFITKRVSDAGLELLVHKGRAFTDLITIMREAEAGGVSVLIIDSISHVWRDLCDSYKKKQKRTRLTFGDWDVLKGQWADFVNLYINSKLHIIMLGRAGFEYDMEEGEDKKMEIRKTGTKMKVEGETGFEPDLLMEMEREQNKDGEIFNVAYILKDRSDTMNGARIVRPKFKDFLPIINFLNIGGEHVGVDVTRNSQDAFDDPDWSYEERKRRREIVLEKIQEALILKGLSGTSSQAVKDRTDTMIKYFGTSAKTQIENMDLRQLDSCLETMKLGLGIVPVVTVPVVTNGHIGVDKTDDIKF